MNPATFLFGLAAENPVQYLRLRRMSDRVYTRIAPLKAELIRSAEPIPFAQLDTSKFAPISPGTSWGRALDCAWLRISGDVPAGVTDAVVLLGIRGEGLIYAPDGTVLDAISRVFQQADLPHSGGRYRPITRVDASRGHIEFLADVAYNGLILYEVGRGTFHGAHLAVRDDAVFALYYDYLTLVVLAGATTDATLATELRRALGQAWARFRRNDITAARAVLAPLLATPTASEFTYSAIGHGHLDMAWLWPLRETRRKAARTYTRQLNNIEDTETYLYGTSQPQQTVVDEAGPARDLRSGEEGRRREPDRAAGLVLGRDRHQHAGRRIAGSPVAGRPQIPCRRNSG